MEQIQNLAGKPDAIQNRPAAVHGSFDQSKFLYANQKLHVPSGDVKVQRSVSE